MNNCRICVTGLQARHTTDGPGDPSYDSYFMADRYPYWDSGETTISVDSGDRSIHFGGAKARGGRTLVGGYGSRA